TSFQNTLQTSLSDAKKGQLAAFAAFGTEVANDLASIVSLSTTVEKTLANASLSAVKQEALSDLAKGLPTLETHLKNLKLGVDLYESKGGLPPDNDYKDLLSDFVTIVELVDAVLGAEITETVKFSLVSTVSTFLESWDNIAKDYKNIEVLPRQIASYDNQL